MNISKHAWWVLSRLVLYSLLLQIGVLNSLNAWVDTYKDFPDTVISFDQRSKQFTGTEMIAHLTNMGIDSRKLQQLQVSIVRYLLLRMLSSLCISHSWPFLLDCQHSELLTSIASSVIGFPTTALLAIVGGFLVQKDVNSICSIENMLWNKYLNTSRTTVQTGRLLIPLMNVWLLLEDTVLDQRSRKLEKTIWKYNFPVISLYWSTCWGLTVSYNWRKRM